MNLLILYASTEGQTRRICRVAADRAQAQGHRVEMLPAAAAATETLEHGRFDAAILAGSIHAGHIQKDLIDAVQRSGAMLSELPTLYLQVSLSAAGDDPEEQVDLARIAERTALAFGFTPTRTEQIAGAFRFSQYDFLKTWAMRWIASEKGEDIPRGEDREYTDWEALGAVLDDWMQRAEHTKVA